MCLQGTASKILELTLGSRDFPSAAVAASAMAQEFVSGKSLSIHMSYCNI